MDEPLLTGPQLAALAAAEAANASGGKASAEQAQQAELEELPPRERVAPVPPELKAQLAHYRWAACLCYDYNTGGRAWPLCCWFHECKRPTIAGTRLGRWQRRLLCPSCSSAASAPSHAHLAPHCTGPPCSLAHHRRDAV